MEPERVKIGNAVRAASEALGPVRRNPAIRAAALAAYELLWFDLGGKPGRYAGLSLAAWAAQFGRDRRSAARWLDELETAGLVVVFERNDGRLDLYVNAPSAIDSLRRIEADPQRTLSGIDQAGPPESEPAATIAFPRLAADAAAHPGSRAEMVPKPPSAAEMVPKPPTTPPARSAQSATGPEVKPHPPPPPRAEMVPKPPARPHGSIERKRSTQDMIHGSMEEPPDADGPHHVSGDLARALDQYANRGSYENQKTEKAQEIIQRVNHPKFHESLANRVAEMVVLNRFAWAKVQRILKAVERGVDKHGQPIRSRGAYANNALKKLYAAHDMQCPWDKSANHGNAETEAE